MSAEEVINKLKLVLKETRETGYHFESIQSKLIDILGDRVIGDPIREIFKDNIDCFIGLEGISTSDALKDARDFGDAIGILYKLDLIDYNN
tara:strand:+ start:60 stop:332 length:273 start_codon:yes stop_codon:yes gene_type:complete